MRAKDYGRIGLGLAFYALFFLLSAWAPFHWPQPARPVARHASNEHRSLQMCGLTLPPPPRLTTDWQDHWNWHEALQAGRVSVQVSIPAPRLANRGPATDEVTPDDSCQQEQIAARPTTLEAAPDVSLAPAKTQLVDDATALPTGSHWQRPVSLLEQLDALRAYDECAAWAAAAMDAVEQLTAPQSAEDRQDELASLGKLLSEVDELVESIDNRSLATLLRRSAHAAQRRLVIWQAVHQIELRDAPEPQFVEAEPQRLAHCLAEVIQATETGAGPNWREYLLVESLSDLASDRRETGPQEARVLARRVLERLAHAKAELPQASFVRKGPLAALDQELRVWAAEPVEVPRLLSQLEEYEQSGAASVGRLIAVQGRQLAFSPLAEERELSRRINAHYRNYNLRVSVSEAMLNRLLPKQQPTTAAVVDTIVGVPVRGRSTTETQLAVRLLPGSSRLRLELEATGVVDASTSSERGPITVFTNSHSHYTARKVLEFAEQGIVASPAEATAESQSRLRCIETDLDAVPLVGSLMGSYAKDQYQSRREQARLEIEAKVERQARQRIDTLAESRFETLHQRFTDRVLTPLDRLELRPNLVEAITTDERFTTRVQLAGRHHLASHTPRPRALSDSLLSVQVHESAINNIVDQLDLAGQTLTVAELRKLIADKLNLPSLLQRSGENDDTLLTFAERDPLSLRCRDGRVELSVALARMQSGSRQWRNFTVHVSYRPQMRGPTVELVRDGTIGLAAERLSLQSQLVLRGTFSRIFSEDRRFALLADEFASDPRLAGLQVTQLVIDDGWIGLAIGPARPTAAIPVMAR